MASCVIVLWDSIRSLNGNKIDNVYYFHHTKIMLAQNKCTVKVLGHLPKAVTWPVQNKVGHEYKRCTKEDLNIKCCEHNI